PATHVHEARPREGRARPRAREEALRETPGDQGAGGRPRDAGGHPSPDLVAEGGRALANFFGARLLAGLERHFLEEQRHHHGYAHDRRGVDEYVVERERERGSDRVEDLVEER